MVALDDGSILSLGKTGAQRYRTLEGQTIALDAEELAGREGQSAIKLRDGSVLVVGGRLGNGEAAPSLVFRSALLRIPRIQ
ncbi:MAG: hypothetical protein GY811_04945 [Myxococcales bacterium]|nr:hypothetical protein [Myxococcales bacterium]